MIWAKRIWSEFIGLFVDDGSFAVAILVWLAFCWLLARTSLSSPWLPILLFLGLALILAESAARRAGRD